MQKVELCGVNTSKLPVLKHEEMRRLFGELRDGNEAAREIIVSGNLRLVLSVVQRFRNRGENMDDLFQIGCVGLIKAVDNFDLSHEVKFSTYAAAMNIGALRRYLRDIKNTHDRRYMRDLV